MDKDWIWDLLAFFSLALVACAVAYILILF